jgi:hypothetical protein
MLSKLRISRFALAATCSVIVLAAALLGGITVWPQTSTLTLTLAGQSMIRSDLRVTDPSAMPGIAALLAAC